MSPLVKSEKGLMRKRVLLVDDHPPLREGLARLIEREDVLSVCGYAEDIRGALEAVNSLKPDAIIVDLALKECDGLELIKDLHVQMPHLPVLVLSMHDEKLYAERSLRAGAKGYIMKEEATELVIQALKDVLQGKIFLSETMKERLLHKLTSNRDGFTADRVGSLSDRELAVYRLIGKGFTSKEIALQFHLSIKTIETYREHIKKKLKLESSPQLVRSAIDWGHSHDSV
jgi:DNA-binding NarL/FixJ family response regulator